MSKTMGNLKSVRHDCLGDVRGHTDVTASEPRWIQLIPDGEVPSVVFPFTLDAEGAKRVMNTFSERKLDLVVDYEHGSEGGEYAPPSGIAPAAGWVGDLRYEPGRGLFGLVKWTKRATNFIREDEYRYLSPTTLHDKDGNLMVLKSVALVTQPAISGMDRVAASDRILKKEIANMDGVNPTSPAEESAAAPVADSPEMILGAIMSQLDISLESTDILDGLKAVLEKVKKGDGDKNAEGDDKPADAAKVANKLRKALDLKDDASGDELLVAINSLKRATVGGESGKQIAELQEQLSELKADQTLEPYLVANKINPNDKEDLAVCRSLAKSDPKALAHQMKHRAAYAEPGKSDPGDGHPGHSASGEKPTREKLIAHSAKQYDTDGHEGRFTSRDNFVNGELIQAGHKALSEDERTKLCV